MSITPDKLRPLTKLAELQRLMDSGKLSHDESMTICWCIGALQHVFDITQTEVLRSLQSQWEGKPLTPEQKRQDTEQRAQAGFYDDPKS